MGADSRRWLFLRGLSRGSGHWGDFPALLQQQLRQQGRKNESFTFVDLPGNGENFLQKSPSRLADYIPAVRAQAMAQWEQQGAQAAPLIVVAISMGGMVTVEWMRQFPDEIHQAFLINTSAGNFSSPFKRILLHNVFRKLLLTRPEKTRSRREQIESRVLSLTANNKQRTAQFLQEFTAYSHSHPVSLYNGYRQILAASKSIFPPQAPGRLTLLASEKDRLVSCECSRRIAKRWQVPLLLNPQAGHDLPLDDPQWLCAQILARLG